MAFRDGKINSKVKHFHKGSLCPHIICQVVTIFQNMTGQGPSHHSTIVKKDLKPRARTTIISNEEWGQVHYLSGKDERKEELRMLEIEQETTTESPKQNPTFGSTCGPKGR